MDRRSFFRSALAASAATAAVPVPAIAAGIPKMKVTRVRAWASANPNPLFNQSDMVVTVETDAGITGVGEGGTPDLLVQCAGRIIGQSQSRIEHLWQDMYRAFFYPPGREKMHALGAIDLALWDIRGKALGLPVHAVLGGMVRNFCELYNTAGNIPGVRPGMGVKERAAATVAAGYRAFRMGAADTPANGVFNIRERVLKLAEDAAAAREGVGKNGDWCVDFHQRFDLADAVRGCEMIQEYAPLF